MKFKVHMVAFEDPIRVRMVEPDISELEACETTEAILGSIFYWGQNDFQPQPCCSVSVGDVIELPSSEEIKCATGDLVDLIMDESSGEETKEYAGHFPLPVDWDPGYWLVAGVGFTKITPEQFEAHKALPQIERTRNAYKLSGD